MIGYGRPPASSLCLMVLLVASPASAGQKISLHQAYDLALKSNPTLRILKERVVQAEAVRYKAWSAIKPTAAFQGTFTHYDQEIIVDLAKSSPVPIAGMEPVVMQEQNQFGFTALASVPLFRGPAYPRIGVTRKGVELARLTEIRSSQDFLLRVAQAYYLVVSREEAVRAIGHKVEVDRQNLSAAKAQFEVGQAARASVMRADLVLTQDEQNLYTQRNGLVAAKRQLGILLGVEGLVEAERPAEPAHPQGSDRALFEVALRERLDLKATDLGLQIAKQSRESIWWSFLPTLDMSWMYRWTEAAGFAGEKGSWNLMFTLGVPLYDAGVRYAELRESQSKILEALEQRRALGQQIESDIVRLRTDVESANSGVISARKAVTLARTTEEDMQASYTVGAVTQLDVLDASQRLLDAELQLTGSFYTRDLARLALSHAVGQFDPLRGDR
jgi:outer membrane protein TolC